MSRRVFMPCLAALTICLRFAQAQSACCSPHAGTGCALPACQASVCQVDPFCCNTQWDERCASEASVLCADCQPSVGCELPPSSVAVTESCGTSTDDPCLGMGFSAVPLPIGVTLHGTAWSSDTARDVDWYQTTFSSPTMLQVSCWSAGPMGVAIVDDQCPPTVLAESPDGCPATVSACVPAGTVRVVVRPLLFESLACLDTRAAYALQATAMPCTPIRPPNDRCDTALPASVGLNAFDCSNATSDPAWLPEHSATAATATGKRPEIPQCGNQPAGDQSVPAARRCPRVCSERPGPAVPDPGWTPTGTVRAVQPGHADCAKATAAVMRGHETETRVMTEWRPQSSSWRL